MKGLIFLCCACAILVFTIINLSISPIVSRRAEDWGYQNCKYYKDEYDKDTSTGDVKKYGTQWNLNECNNTKGMHDMEYTSFIFNIVIGFTCGLLGLLHHFGLKKEFVPKTGLIGLGCGIIGFIFSFVYVILNGIVFTTYDLEIPKRDSDGAFAELKGDKYECFYYDNKYNIHALRATFSDLIKKQYNYDKDLRESYNKPEVSQCKYSSYEDCNDYEGNIPKSTVGQTYPVDGTNKDCPYLYVDEYPTTSNSSKDIADRFLTTLLLSLFVCIANLGLALFGFLLFRTPDNSQQKTEVNVNNQNPTSKFSVDQKLNS